MRWIACYLAAALMLACNKGDDAPTSPVFDGKTCYLKYAKRAQDFLNGEMYYFYNEGNKLTRTQEISSNFLTGTDTLTTNFVYDDEGALYSYTTFSHRRQDTTRYRLLYRPDGYDVWRSNNGGDELVEQYDYEPGSVRLASRKVGAATTRWTYENGNMTRREDKQGVWTFKLDHYKTYALPRGLWMSYPNEFGGQAPDAAHNPQSYDVDGYEEQGDPGYTFDSRIEGRYQYTYNASGYPTSSTLTEKFTDIENGKAKYTETWTTRFTFECDCK